MTVSVDYRTLLNLSNLHVGGGIQVAASVITELQSSRLHLPYLTVALSSAVMDAVGRPINLTQSVGELLTLNLEGLSAGDRRTRGLFDQHDAVLTLFGPLYRWSPPFRNIVGFAQPWIIYPHNEVYGFLPLLTRLRTRFKFWIQAQFFKRADELVVELEHVKSGLVRELGIDPRRIHVIHNCVSALYRNQSQWEALVMPETPGILRLGFVGRNYIHKNTSIFPEVVSALWKRYGVKSTFFVTFTSEEWRNCSSTFREACINLGPLRPAQCPNFYRGLDAVVFPSLLECFSATPLETMAMGVPLFASDRPFNHDVCQEHAYYFDPMSPDTAADQIAKWNEIRGGQKMKLEAAQAHAFAFASPANRAEKYLALLQANAS